MLACTAAGASCKEEVPFYFEGRRLLPYSSRAITSESTNQTKSNCRRHGFSHARDCYLQIMPKDQTQHTQKWRLNVTIKLKMKL